MDEEISVCNYIKDNFIGLLMLMCVFVIIYLVDNINQLNAFLFSIQPNIPTSTITLNYKKLKNKKLKT
jgi:hypothetical protein